MSHYRINDLSPEQIHRWLSHYNRQIAYLTMSNRSERETEVPLGRMTLSGDDDGADDDPFEQGDAPDVVEEAAPENASLDIQAERVWEWINDLVRGEVGDADVQTVRFRLRFYAIKGSMCLLSPAFSVDRLLPARQKTDVELFGPDNLAIANTQNSAFALLFEGFNRLQAHIFAVQANQTAATQSIVSMSLRQLDQLAKQLDRSRATEEALVSALTGAKLRRLDTPARPTSPDGEGEGEGKSQVAIAAIEQIGKAVELLAIGREVSPEQRETLGKLLHHPKLGPLLKRSDLGKLVDNEEAVDFIVRQLEWLDKQANEADTPATPSADEPPPDFE